MGPVSQRPSGTTTRPPPAAAHAWMATRNAAVQSVVPSPTAPWSVMRTSRSGNVGGMMRARIPGTRAHPIASAPAAAVAVDAAEVDADDAKDEHAVPSGSTMAAPAPTPSARTKSRREMPSLVIRASGSVIGCTAVQVHLLPLGTKSARRLRHS